VFVSAGAKASKQPELGSTVSLRGQTADLADGAKHMQKSLLQNESAERIAKRNAKMQNESA
jgi:hypothetical protein